MNKILIILFVLINLFTFIIVGIDKDLAVNTTYGTKEDTLNRIAEVTITAYSAWGGAIGTYLGFYVFRHKTSYRKLYLRKAIFSLIIQNIIFWFAVFFVFNKRIKPLNLPKLKRLKEKIKFKKKTL